MMTVLPSGSRPLLLSVMVYSNVSPMLKPGGATSLKIVEVFCSTGTGNGSTVVPASRYGVPVPATAGSSPHAAEITVPSNV